MSIDEHLFAGVDLNLLVVFLVIFREGSLSRAAGYLQVHQPAVSGSLARLRQRFDDPLFVRAGRGVKPTAKALDIADALLPAMSAIGAVLSADH